MDYDGVRSPEQVLRDLAGGLGFSVNCMAQFRKGRLPAMHVQPLMKKVLRPAMRCAALTIVPLLLLAYAVTASSQASVSEGLHVVYARIMNPKELAEAIGWFRVVLYFAGGLAMLILGIVQATKIPMDLLADVIAGRVAYVEGRITGREVDKNLGQRAEVTLYYFDMKDRTFEVSREAFRAIDSGGSYRAYFTPRGRMLVAVEPSVLAREAEQEQKATQPQTSEV